MWQSDLIAQTIPGIREGVPDLHFTLSTADAPLIVQFAGNDPDRDRPGGQMRGGGTEFRMPAELCPQRTLWRVLNGRHSVGDADRAPDEAGCAGCGHPCERYEDKKSRMEGL